LIPLALIIIYTFVFGIVMEVKLGGVAGGNKYAFVVFLCAGLLPWNTFTEMLQRGTTVFVDNAHLIKKVRFPLEILQSVVVGSASLNFLIAFGLYLIVIAATGHGISSTILLLPVFLIFQVFFTVGLGMFLAVFNVLFRDVQ